jgi:hypothetical protein
MMTDEQIDAAIDLGFRALHQTGGGDYRESHPEYCQCDHDVGHVPCEYCALFDALKALDQLRARVAELEGALREIPKQLDSCQCGGDYICPNCEKRLFVDKDFDSRVPQPRKEIRNIVRAALDGEWE